MNKIMDGKVGFVTGSASGIGRATAIEISKQGGVVVVSDINREDGEETVRIIRSFGGQAEFMKADITREADVINLIDYTVANFGRLDFAHNNAAGAMQTMELADYDSETNRWALNMYLESMFYCLKNELLVMKGNGGGSIVNTASMAGIFGVGLSGPYVATKHGVVGYTKSAALEYAKYGIRVNAVCPGTVLTGLTENMPKGEFDFSKLTQAQAIKRLADPSEIAYPVVFLLSDMASYITGLIMPVDGGAGISFASVE